MRKATQQAFLETLVALSLQEQVHFCVGADKPCKAAEVTLFTLVQSQIAIFLFFFLWFTEGVRAIGSLAEPECFWKAAACVNTSAGSRRSVICQPAPLFVLLRTLRENKATTSEQSRRRLVLMKGFEHSFTLHGR